MNRTLKSFSQELQKKKNYMRVYRYVLKYMHQQLATHGNLPGD